MPQARPRVRGLSDAAGELADLREEWDRLLGLATPEVWGRQAAPDGTVADLFAGLVAELELACSPAATPRFALDFIETRIARKLGGRYSRSEMSGELERRYVRAAETFREAGDDGFAAAASLSRLRQRVARLRSVLEG